MYTIKLDGEYIYYPGDNKCAVIDPVVKLSIGQAGSCEFVVPPFNPLYGSIYNRKSIVSVYRGSKLIFRGEVRESTKNKLNCKKVYAVGELAYLLDSIQPQYRYGPIGATSFMTAVLAEHNSQVEARKQFTMGTCVPNESYGSSINSKITDYEDTLTALRTQIDSEMGGYFRVRYVNNTKYLDCVDIINYGTVNHQGINFGENLLDYAENLTSSDIVTEVIPLGTRLESDDEDFEKRLDIKSVNNGKNYLTSTTGVNSFGHVRRRVVFDEIDNAATLKQAGQEWLTKNQYETLTLKVSAADLSALDSSMDDMSLGDQIPCCAPPYGLDITLPIMEQTLHLAHPEKDTIVLSASWKNKKRTISGQVSDSAASIKNEVYKEELKIRAVIARETANILKQFTGSEGGHKLEEYDENGLWLRTSLMNGTSKATSTRIMEFSMDGIRMYNGPAGSYSDPTKWKTAWSINGGFCADFIVTGTLLASLIKAGILSDAAGNTTWNMETGELITKVLQLISNYLTISNTGVITSRSMPNGQGVSEESLEIEQAVIRGKRYGTDVGYIDLSADTDSGDGAAEYDAVIGSSSTLRLEFYRQIDIVDKYNNTLVGYFDGNGWHGPIDDSFLPEPTVIYVNNGGNGNSSGSGSGGNNSGSNGGSN